MTKDMAEVLEALLEMWNQYCSYSENGKTHYWHLCMSAGEDAEIVLRKHGLLLESGAPDWDRMTLLRVEAK